MMKNDGILINRPRFPLSAMEKATQPMPPTRPMSVVKANLFFIMFSPYHSNNVLNK
jgi:hypothetical protein